MKNKVLKKLTALCMIAISLVTGAFTVNADTNKFSSRYVGYRGYEYAIFPSSTVHVSQKAYNSYSHKGKNVTDIVPSGRVYAPFSGTIRYIDKSWGYVILESDDKVVWADGTTEKMCVGFMHDENVSDLKVGQHILQGQEFYDKGKKKGKGGDPITGAHVHIIIMRGAFTKSMKSNYSSRGNVWIYQAFWLERDTSIKKSGYDKNKWRYIPDTNIMCLW